VLFTADSGDLDGHTILVINTKSTGFQSAKDYAIDITDATNLGHFGLDTFV
jgi:hypothetical protein